MAADPAVRELWRRAHAAADQPTVQAFQRDGAVCLRQLLHGDELALLRSGIEFNLAHPSPRALNASRPGDPGAFVEDFCNWQRIEAYRRFILESPLAQTGALLMHSQSVRLYHDHLLCKSPGTTTATPWHQDQPYYNVSGSQNISYWIPVDPVLRPSTLEFLAGSHRGPWLMPRSFMDHQARWFPPGSLSELPDIEARRDSLPIIGWALEPGDVVAFHMLTLHAAAGVDAGRQRRVFSLRLLGDDMRHAPRAWKTSPEFPGLAQSLPAGAAMDDPRFPLLVDGLAGAT